MSWVDPFVAITGAVIASSDHNAGVRGNLLHIRGLLPDGSTPGFVLQLSGVNAGVWALVGTSNLADGGVTFVKIADGSVFGSKIPDLGIGGVKLSNLTVTMAKLVADGTPNRVVLTSDGTNMVMGQINSSMLGTNAVNNINMAADAVQGVNIVAGAVNTTQLANSGVTTAKIADANVTTPKIADTNVTLAKLSSGAGTNGQVLSTNGSVLQWITVAAVAGVPSGVELFWTSTAGSIPAGYSSDSSAVDRILIGAGSTYSPGATGGATTHSHTVNSHTHPSTGLSGSITGAIGLPSSGMDNTVNLQHAGGDHVAGDHLHSHTLGVSLSGATAGATPGTDSPSHLPPYLARIPIIKS